MSRELGEEPPSSLRIVRVALAGNPNSGKTSLFNALTGANQHVGNYPGVTVEKRRGTCVRDGVRFEILDLPGSYSLTSYTPEERIAQEEILEGNHDVVVVVVDSNTLNRSLVLLAQVMLTGARPVLSLNMSDEAFRAGQRIDVDKMQVLLGFPVIETVGHRGLGADRLLEAIRKSAITPAERPRVVLGERLDAAILAIRARLGTAVFAPALHGWVAVKLLVGEQAFLDAAERGQEEEAIREALQRRHQIESETGMDISLFVTERFFGFVDGLLKEVVTHRARVDARELSNRIDKVLVNRVVGLPLFALVMFGIFWVTFSVGEAPMGWIEAGFGALGRWVSGWWPDGSSSVIRSLLVDGVIGGVGGVLVFLPNILLLFLGLAFLEDTGYMARAAFLMDRVMHLFGLHGKSFLPMLTGFGCTIPGIMATRTLENERDRLTTMLVLPLIPCGARLPILMLLIPAFFAESWRAPVLWAVYTGGIVLALFLALLLRRSLLRGEDAPFVMELPPYRLPTLRAVVLKMWGRGWLYLRKAGTVILAISLLMWVITAYPKPEQYQVDLEQAAGRLQELDHEQLAAHRAAEDLRYSIAGRLGRTLEPIVAPLGFDWRIVTGMIGAFAAKEVFVAQMGIVYSMGEATNGPETLRAALRRDYPPSVGLALILFLMIGAPCMATVAITRRESGAWKWALLQFGGLTAIAYLVSLVVYQVGRLVS
ncbi:MAG: ferrous iron transport protein B [Bradymonadales bacterium]|nr:ferrous iron transport protein B [Bradymonadales bacterium]